jgi:hypothetical protein
VTPEQKFETQWISAKSKIERIARSYLPREASFDLVEDFLQDAALHAWRDFDDKALSADFLGRFRAAAKHTWKDLRSQERTRPKLETQPQQFFEECARPFADIWGRIVPSEHWRSAEDYSLAPLDWDERYKWITGYPALYYLSMGASLKETAQLIGVSPAVLRQALERLKHKLISAGSQKRLRALEFPGLLKTELPFLPPLGFSPTPNAPSLLRTLPGFVPEWIAWFVQLSRISSEPITLHLIKQLARQYVDLTEEQGMRFLLAVAAEPASLLSQEFIDLSPNAKQRTLSLSDIYQLLRGEDHPTPDSPYGVTVDRMTQIATFWAPTARWYEVEPW